MRKTVHMSRRNAETETIRKLFAAYTRQGIKKDKAIMLIGAALGLPQKQILDTVDTLENGSSDN
jgi:hypothetical protein